MSADFSYNVQVTPLGTIPIPGPVGPSGPSAYTIAVEEGYVGTEAEWVASLAGPPGPPGSPGGTGPTGPTGTQGPSGSNAYTRTSASFTVPAVGAIVQVPVTDATWIVVGQSLYVAGAATGSQAGILQITSLTGNSLTLLNPAGGSAVGGTVIASGALVTPGGPIGPTGPPGVPGPVGPSGTPAWATISGKPTVFPPSPHTHPESDVTNLVADLNARALVTTTVSGTKSLAGGGGLSGNVSISLVNDAANPGVNQFYGTNAVGGRGWWLYGSVIGKDAPAAGDASTSQVVLGSDSRLANARTPLAHALSHSFGATDPVHITKAQISDLPGIVTTTVAGFVPVLPGTNPTNLFFRGDAAWAPATVDTSSLVLSWNNIDHPLATTTTPGVVPILHQPTASSGSGAQTQVWLRGEDAWAMLPRTAYTSQTFALPALGSSTTVSIAPSVRWPQLSSVVFFSDGTTRGFLEVSAVGSGPPYASVSLTNRGYLLSSAPGTTVNSGAEISLQSPSLATSSNAGYVPSLPGNASQVFLGNGLFGTIPLVTTTVAGTVPPIPTVNQTLSYLRADLTWQPLPVATATVSGLVPTPPNDPTKWLRGDAAWAAIALATPSAAGLLRTLNNTGQQWLRDDGNWAVPSRYYGTDTTNATNYAITVANDFSLVTGVVVWVTPSLANAANPTLNVNGTGAKALVNRANIAFSYANELAAAKTFGAMYDGTSWRVITPVGRVYLATAPGTVAVECAGFDFVNIRITVGIASATALTLAHLTHAVPVTLSLSNTYTAANTYTVAVTNPIGTAGTTYVTFASTVAGAVAVALSSAQSLTNGNQFTWTGSMDANNELLFR